ncbi:hypothetical protein HKD37_19G053172 [Glycine soja]
MPISPYGSIGIVPTRHPVDPEEPNRALGFPALVTGLWIVPTRHPVDPEEPNRALGFPALVTGLSVSPTGCPFPPARGSAHKTPSGPGGAQQGPGISSSGYGPLSILQGITRARHSVDPEKSNRVLELPALITGLCRFYGVPVAPSKVIRPPTNRAFIKKYCAPRQAQGKTPQQPGDGRQRATDAPPPPLEFTSSHPQKG